jgi:type IV secretion system protein VirB3
VGRDHLPEGFEVPVHRSLAEPLLIAGLPRTLAFLLWTVAAACVLGLRQFWILPIAIVTHLALAAITRRDPHFFDVFLRALKHQERLEP